MSNPEPFTLDPGCYFDGCRGIYIGKAVQEMAVNAGWQGEHILDPGHEFYHEATDEATEFLAQFAPADHCTGFSESGDWGVWEIEA